MGAVSPAIRQPQPRGTSDFSDQQLVACVASGDTRAFEEIVDRYGSSLLGFCSHMLGSREWGEDALQMTFVAAYTALRRGACDGALRPWLYAIARNRCLSELRGRREIPESDQVSAERPAIDGPASLFARREQLRETVEDIQRLPDDQRTALVLFELGGESHEEIATVLGVRREKVKALIFQAREGLHRGRSARDSACSDVREGLANARGKVPARGILRAHIDRCAACRAFEREVRGQRAALALVLPVALTGKLKALVLKSALAHGSAGAATVTGAGGAGSLSAATAVTSGSGAVAGPGSVGVGAAASAGSAGTALAGSAVGGATVSAAAGTAAPTVIASTLGTEAVAGVGALTSSVSVATVAKLVTVLAVAVGVGDIARSALAPSPRPKVSFLGTPSQRPPLRSPLQPLASGLADPLVGAAQPGPQPGAGAASAQTPTVTARAPSASSSTAPPAMANPTGLTKSSPTGARNPPSPMGSTSAPATSAPGNGSPTTSTPASGSSGTPAPTTTTTPSSPSGSRTTTPTTTATSQPATTTAGSSSGSTAASSSGSNATEETSAAPSSGSGGSNAPETGPGDSAGQGRSSGGKPGAGPAPSNGNGPPITPPGCVNNPAPGCAKKLPGS